MTALGVRLSKLETQLGQNRPRVIAVRSTGASEDKVDAFLHSLGIDYDPQRDLVPHIRIFGRSTAVTEVELMNITEIRR